MPSYFHKRDCGLPSLLPQIRRSKRLVLDVNKPTNKQPRQPLGTDNPSQVYELPFVATTQVRGDAPEDEAEPDAAATAETATSGAANDGSAIKEKKHGGHRDLISFTPDEDDILIAELEQNPEMGLSTIAEKLAAAHGRSNGSWRNRAMRIHDRLPDVWKAKVSKTPSRKGRFAKKKQEAAAEAAEEEVSPTPTEVPRSPESYYDAPKIKPDEDGDDDSLDLPNFTLDDFKRHLERQVGQTTKEFQVPMEVGDEFDRDIYTANEYAEYGGKPTAYLPDYIEDENGNPDYFVVEEDD